MQKPSLLISLTCIFIFLTIAKAFYFTIDTGGTDLRNRTVASRLITTSHSPYFYKWNPADGEYYLDPNDIPLRLVNGTTVTPATLYLLYPVSSLPYNTVRILWTIIQFISAFGILLLIFRHHRRFLPAALIAVGIISTDLWLLNIERGQVYIIYALFFALIYYSYYARWKNHELVSGIIAGVFILVRPFAICLALPFLLKKKLRWLTGCLIGIAISVTAFVLPRPAAWTDYFKAIKEYSNEIVGNAHQNNTAPEIQRPPVIEGTTNLYKARDMNIGQLDTAYQYLSRVGIKINNTQSLIVFALIAILLSLLFIRSGKKGSIFLFGFLIYFLATLFTIVPRNAYVLIEWIFPLSLIAIQIWHRKDLLIVLIVGLLLLHNFPLIFPHQTELAELIFLGLMLYVIFSKQINPGPEQWELQNSSAPAS